jgi:uncharacterized membrane protein
MIRLTKLLALVLLALICLAYVAAPVIADASSTDIRVEVLSNGDARWTTEKKIPLETPEDITGWDATAVQGTDGYRSEFDVRMKDTVSQISASIGRPMAVEDVNVTVEKAHPYALSDNGTTTYGIIRYDFTWKGFAMARGDSLEVGDAFVDGFLLNKDDAITFVFPPGYEVVEISPAPDDVKNAYQPQVRWMGSSVNGTSEDIRLFSSGEPSIIMHKTSVPLFSFEWWMLIPVILLSAVVGFGAGYVLLRRRQPGPVEVPPLPDRVAIPDAGTEVEQHQEFGEDRYLSDGEKVVMYLEEAGGQMFQSDLVRKTDFSKSKLSMVLSDLKEKGTILKIKKGKENLIRLNRPSSDDKPDDKDGPA